MSVKIKLSAGFRSNNGTKSLHLYRKESIFKSICKATLRSHLLFCQQAVPSESCKHSNSMRMSFFFIQKSVNRCHISLGILTIQALYIHNIYSILIEQYFIDMFGSILKLSQVFWNTLLNPKNVFYFLHTPVWLSTIWAH